MRLLSNKYLFFFSFFLAQPLLWSHFMLDYRTPIYRTEEVDHGVWKIEVDVKVGSSEVNEETRKKLLAEEAQKTSLFAIAFIQKLALDGDVQAQNIAAIYQAYRSFFENGDKNKLMICCQQMTESVDAAPLARSFARCIQLTLEGRRIDPSLEEARTLLDQLIPQIEQTLTMELPLKIHDGQEVSIPEMAEAKHKAFPDLIKYQGDYYVCFREANSHVGYKDFGKIRILKGKFQEGFWNWENAALLAKEGWDLRDPKFFVDGKDILHMMMGGSKISEKDETIWMSPHVAKFTEGQWQIVEANADKAADGSKGQWIWKTTWNSHDNRGYAFSYGNEDVLCLMRTEDGIQFEKVAELRHPPLTDLSEGVLRFKKDGTAVSLIRTRRNALIGTASPESDYKNWTFNVVPFRVGGPDFILLENEQMWAATRHFFLDEENRLDEATIIARMDEKTLTPALRLKSHLDNSYPGMVLEEDGSISVIYYSSEPGGQSKIYIARAQLPK